MGAVTDPLVEAGDGEVELSVAGRDDDAFGDQVGADNAQVTGFSGAEEVGDVAAGDGGGAVGGHGGEEALFCRGGVVPAGVEQVRHAGFDAV